MGFIVIFLCLAISSYFHHEEHIFVCFFFEFMTEHELWPHFVCFAGLPTTHMRSNAINDKREFFIFFRRVWLRFSPRIFFPHLFTSYDDDDDDDVSCLLNFLTLECLQQKEKERKKKKIFSIFTSWSVVSPDQWREMWIILLKYNVNNMSESHVFCPQNYSTLWVIFLW